LFGYVRPFKPQLRMMEYDTYKAVYCGMCRQLGEAYGPIARFTLSYDFTFMALLELALSEDSPSFARCRCYANPLKKRYCCQNRQQLEFSCASAMIMLHHKLVDNLQDGRWYERLAARALLLLTGRGSRRAAQSFPAVEAAASRQMREQGALEAARCASPDRAAEPTAQALSAILALLDDDPAQKRVLERFGYLLGRWIYLMDALDDLPRDLRRGNYNPFALQYGLAADASEQQIAQAREAARGTLYLTVGEMEQTFALLRLCRYEEIFQNFTEFGFRSCVQQLFADPKERNDQPT